jgi:hypothetical protein
MSDATLVHRLFQPPGCPAADGEDLQRLAAAAHAELLAGACVDGGSTLGHALAPLRTFLGGHAPAALKRRLLCHPLLIEGLHALAPLSAALRQWHDSVAAAPPRSAVPAAAALGNVTLALVLRGDPDWCGDIDLCTDVIGRVGFPFCDWTLALHTPAGDLVASRIVRLTLTAEEAVWRLAESATPFLVMSRADCVRMLVANADPVDRGRLVTPDAHVRPRLQQACPFARSAIRYDPVGFRGGHAGLTGAVMARVLTAIRRNSPAVHREMGRLIHTVRGFEYPPAQLGRGASFSDPTLPGVIGVGLSYGPHDEPCLDPFCFTWFGHELGHTKDYLCDSVLHGHGQALVLNPADVTDPIPRYGRPLAVRTLFQVPYVHLYEWALLMDFWEGGFRGLPWPAPAGAAAVGDDLAAEVREAFALIRDRAKLTPLGETALRHFRELFGVALARWRFVRSHGGH